MLRAMRAPLLLVVFLAAPVHADEGMWTFDNFPAARVGEQHGFTPDAAWLERVRLASARVAGCSASFVSPSGLVMTNHHCARSCIEDVSTSARDLIADGFLARTPAEELRCPGEHADQLVAITDVTSAITAATKGRTGEAFAEALRAERGRLEQACQTDAKTRCEVITLYQGGRYHLYRYRRWGDVRLVFAPEEAIASFGGDPDNYEYPRWNLDVAFYRIYEDGKPARPSHHFAWSRAGARAGELIFVAGHPGRTDRLMTVAQLEDQRDHALPEDLFLLSEQRGFLEELLRRGAEERRIAHGKTASVNHRHKRLRGQRRLLVDPRFFAGKVAAERELRERVAADAGLAARTGAAWDEIAAAVAGTRELRTAYQHLEGGAYEIRMVTPRGFDSRLFVLARILVRGATERKQPSARRLRELQDASLPALEKELLSTAPIHDALEIATLTFSLTRMREELSPDHPLVARLLAKETPEELATRVVRGTRLKDVEQRRRLWGAARLDPASDPMLALAALVEPEARAARKLHEERTASVLSRNGELIARARFDVYGTTPYPDATFTLRLSYGTMRGVKDGGRDLPPATTFAGLYARATERAPFALPRRWLDARPRLRLDTPFNAIGTPDTTGGNSGSPVLNRAGEIVGCYFDQNRWGTASAFGYDETRRRGVFVHSAGIVEALDKVYGARELLAELGK
jgi:hypothetical protein